MVILKLKQMKCRGEEGFSWCDGVLCWAQERIFRFHKRGDFGWLDIYQLLRGGLFCGICVHDMENEWAILAK